MKTDRGFSDSEASTVVLVSPLETSDSDVEAAGDPEEMVREFFNCVVRREPNASQAGSFVRLANKHGEVLERASEVARANLLRMGKAQARIKELETRVLQLENKVPTRAVPEGGAGRYKGAAEEGEAGRPGITHHCGGPQAPDQGAEWTSAEARGGNPKAGERGQGEGEEDQRAERLPPPAQCGDQEVEAAFHRNEQDAGREAGCGEADHA